MKKLGLIGGTSYHSTIEYYRGINEEVSKTIGADKNPTLLIYSLNIELMRSGDIDRIKKEYLRIANELKKIGAEGILICANTPHLVYEYVQPKIDIPILHIAEAIGNYAKKNNWSKVGLLGTKPTVKFGFIADYLLQNYAIETILPETEDIDEVHNYISKELTQGIFSEKAKVYFLNQMDKLEEKGAEAMILGCTELPQLINKNDTEHNLIDTTGLHINLAAEFILGHYE
jgi:aspartate racemase